MNSAIGKGFAQLVGWSLIHFVRRGLDIAMVAAIAGWLLVGPATERPAVATATIQEPVQHETKLDEKLLKKVRVSVVAPDQTPIAGASLTLGIWYQATANTLNFTTDENGVAEVPLPEGLRIFRLWAAADGYTPLNACWEEADIRRGDLPPLEFTFEMIRAVEIGGVFVDEDDQPIEGVAVEVRGEGDSVGSMLKGRVRFEASYAINDDRSTKTTDDQGRWSLANIPPVDDLAISLRITHPDYLSDENWGEIQSVQAVGLKELRDQTAKIVLRKGNKVRGSITAGDGELVSDALIIWGDNPYFQPGSQEMSINADGSYETPTQKDGKLRITVVAPGYAPESTIVEVGPEMEPTDFVLAPGKRLEIRFVDEEGKPATGVFVGITRWRNTESLYNRDHPNVRSTRIPARCDEESVYVWDWAPYDAVTYSFYSRRYLAQSDVSLTASGEPITVVMKLRKELTGLVKDADGQPIKSFFVIPQLHVTKHFANERRDQMVQGKDGKFSIKIDSQDGDYSLKIEAEGYESVVSETFHRGAAAGPFEISMKPASSIEYQVVNDEGQPVPGATVVVAPVGQVLRLQSYSDGIGVDQTQYVTTESDGSCTLPSSPGPRTLMAISDTGFGEFSEYPENPITKMQTKKWGSVKGFITQDGQPWAASAILHCNRYFATSSGHVQIMEISTSRRDGRFQFRKIPALPSSINVMDQKNPQGLRYSLAFTPEPGKEFDLDFTNSSNLKAIFKLSGGTIDKVDLTRTRFLLTRLEPSAEIPGELKQEMQANGLDRDLQEALQWFTDHENWDATSSLRNCFDSYSGPVSEDGKFSVDLLRGGKYLLKAMPFAKSNSNVGGGFLSDFSQVIEIGEKSVDLGELEVPLFDDPQSGSVVADFEFAVRTDQSKTSLSASKGKYVLLDFWCPWCDACELDTPKVQRLVNTLAAKGKTTVISLMANGSVQKSRVPTTVKPGVVWIDGQLSVADANPISKRLGVWTSQHFVLIDPDGTYVIGGSFATVVQRMEELRLK